MWFARILKVCSFHLLFDLQTPKVKDCQNLKWLILIKNILERALSKLYTRMYHPSCHYVCIVGSLTFIVLHFAPVFNCCTNLKSQLINLSLCFNFSNFFDYLMSYLRLCMRLKSKKIIKISPQEYFLSF